MGTYVNPGNAGFRRILNGNYVDKTGLIGLMNDTLDSPRSLVAVTRPRRFGKSYAAQSLAAYYSCGASSQELFAGLDVSRRDDFATHLNAYNLVQLDMTGFTRTAGADVMPDVERRLLDELHALVPEAGAGFVGRPGELVATLLDVVRTTGRKFVFVIDEWDAVYRESVDDEAAGRRYAEWLRSLFKNGNFTDEAVAGAYMTGILPIKKYGHQSAVSDFWEYTMVSAAEYAPYVGFTEDEVEALCASYGMDLDEMRRWYDGYDLPRAGHIFAPFSVMRACQSGRCGSYWTSSDTYVPILEYVDMDFDGLRDDVVRLLGGDEVIIDPGSFQNDMTSVESRDDVLTLLVHLGYLAFDIDVRTVRIPNEEIREEFRRALKNSRHTEVARIVRESESLLRATWALDEAAVAAGVARAHETGGSTWFYNDEQALRAVVRAAYIAAADYYVDIEELESGRGRADIVYLPKRGVRCPALVVELKWNETAETALAQIRDRNYPDVLVGWGGEVLLVGISYDAKTREHTCRIERLGASMP